MRILPLLFLAACAADPSADLSVEADRARSDADLASGARPVTEEDLAALVDRVEALEARNASVDAALKASGIALSANDVGVPCLAFYDEKAGWTCDDGDLAEMVGYWGDRGITHMDDWAIGD